MTIVCAGRHTRCRYGSVGLLKGLFVEKTFAHVGLLEAGSLLKHIILSPVPSARSCLSRTPEGKLQGRPRCAFTMRVKDEEEKGKRKKEKEKKRKKEKEEENIVSKGGASPPPPAIRLQRGQRRLAISSPRSRNAPLRTRRADA